MIFCNSFEERPVLGYAKGQFYPKGGSLKLLALVLTAFVLPQTVWAWSDLGHQTTAEIAQRFLSGKGQKLVNEILGNGPLAESSTFADLVKSDTAYTDFAALHFVEIDPQWGTYDKVPAALRPVRDADTVLQLVPEKLFSMADTMALFNTNQRRDLLKFLVHVVGDAHQPLHVGNGFDRGATWCDIKYPGNDGKASHLSSTNLHAFWDTNLVNFVFTAQAMKDPAFKQPKFQGFSELADLILQDKDIAALKADYDKIGSEPILEWYKQSQALHAKVYPDATPVAHPKERTYCKHLERDANGAEVKDDKGITVVVPATTTADVDLAYMQSSAEIVKLQILKGGLRLAHVLNQIGEKQYTEGLDPKQKTQDLKNILDQLVNVTK
jgi:hypothetical protein